MAQDAGQYISLLVSSADMQTEWKAFPLKRVSIVDIEFT